LLFIVHRPYSLIDNGEAKCQELICLKLFFSFATGF
jgi:hypothetical protein